MINGISGGTSAWARPDPAKMASQLFSRLDTQNQGYISESDLAGALGETSSGTSASSDSSQTEALFKQLDGDGDGKVTESELSSGLQNIMSQLDTQMQYMGKRGFGGEGGHHGGPEGAGGMGGMGGMPPGPPPQASGTDDTDEGFTQDQLTSMASSATDSNSQRNTLFSALASNFSSADTDGNGKVSRNEAMSYAKENNLGPGANNNSATTASNSDTGATSSSDSDGAALMKKIMQLMHAYEQGSGSSTASSSSSISVAC